MSVNQPTEKQQAASRANGAKSKGPVSVEGRARSSQNALRHGLSAAVVVLPHEDRAAFESVRDSYMESFQPADQPQHDLVETMAAARWRLNRLQEIEAKLFEKEMVLRDDDMEKELSNMSAVEKLAWVFDHMANQTKSLQLLIRYEGSLNRSYERAYKQLQQMQKDRPPQQNEPKPAPLVLPARQNEPKPEPESAPEASEIAPTSPTQPDQPPKSDEGRPDSAL